MIARRLRSRQISRPSLTASLLHKLDEAYQRRFLVRNGWHVPQDMFHLSSLRSDCENRFFFFLTLIQWGILFFIAIPFISVSFTTYLTFAVNSFFLLHFFSNFLFGLCYAFPLFNHHFVGRQKFRNSELYVAERWRGDKTRGSKTGWEVWAGAAVNGRLSFELSEIRGTSWVAVC